MTLCIEALAPTETNFVQTAAEAARMADEGVPHRGETSVAKFFAAETLISAVSVCNATLGGYGGHLDYPAERYLRDAFTWVAAQGTTEIQKLTACRELFPSR